MEVANRAGSVEIPDDVGIVGELHQCCMDNLLQCASNSPQRAFTTVQKRRLKRITQSLFIWGTDHGVSSGSLDTRLQHSSRLMKLVVYVLQSLLRSVAFDLRKSIDVDSKLKVVHLIERSRFSQRGDDHESDSNSDVSDESESDNEQAKKLPNFDAYTNEEVLDQIDKNIDRLDELNVPLSTVVAKAANLPSLEAPVIQAATPYQYFSNLIRESFPMAPMQMVDDLGKENFARFCRLLAIRESGPQEAEIAQSTKNPQESVFQDSGYGSKISALLSEYAPSIVSSMTNRIRSKYPAFPDTARAGKPFECAACGQNVQISSQRQYRKHIIQDLVPYPCIYNTCMASRPPFQSQDTWVNHMLHEHENVLESSKDLKCQLCEKSMGSEKHAYLVHTARHLEEIALAVIPLEPEEGEASSAESSVDEEQPLTSGDHPKGQYPQQYEFMGNETSTSQFGLQQPGTPKPMPSGDYVPRPRYDHDIIPNALQSTLEQSSAQVPGMKPPNTLNSTAPDPNGLPEQSGYTSEPNKGDSKLTVQCSLCPKRFTRAYNLRSHLRTHTDERPFVCTICGKAFARQHERERHEALHSGERKFFCGGTLRNGEAWGCGRRFARSDALGRHFRSGVGKTCIEPFNIEHMQEIFKTREMQKRRTNLGTLDFNPLSGIGLSELPPPSPLQRIESFDRPPPGRLSHNELFAGLPVPPHHLTPGFYRPPIVLDHTARPAWLATQEPNVHPSAAGHPYLIGSASQEKKSPANIDQHDEPLSPSQLDALIHGSLTTALNKAQQRKLSGSEVGASDTDQESDGASSPGRHETVYISRQASATKASQNTAARQTHQHDIKGKLKEVSSYEAPSTDARGATFVSYGEDGERLLHPDPENTNRSEEISRDEYDARGWPQHPDTRRTRMALAAQMDSLQGPPESIMGRPDLVVDGRFPTQDSMASMGTKERRIRRSETHTKIERRLVNPQALDERHERYEEVGDHILVSRMLTDVEIQGLADRTNEIRAARSPKIVSIDDQRWPVLDAKKRDEAYNIAKTDEERRKINPDLFSYQTQLQLLDEQNKRRLEQARVEEQEEQEKQKADYEDPRDSRINGINGNVSLAETEGKSIYDVPMSRRNAFLQRQSRQHSAVPSGSAERERIASLSRSRPPPLPVPSPPQTPRDSQEAQPAPQWDPERLFTEWNNAFGSA